MKAEDYFKDWLKVIDMAELNKILRKLSGLWGKREIFPSKSDVFRAFELCGYYDCRIIVLGMSPYADGKATGLAFANREYPLSPSLEVIKNSVIDLHSPHNLSIFDASLESWERQGVLLLNSALTVERNRPESHLVLWRPFISTFLRNMSDCNPGIVYMLFGSEAQSFEPYIGRNSTVFREKHPAWYARTGRDMPSDIFRKADREMRLRYNVTINWYNEL